jgi:glucose/arabinose dehydrogenase
MASGKIQMIRTRGISAILICGGVATFLLGTRSWSQTIDANKVRSAGGENYRVVETARLGDVIWGIDQLPDGRLLVTLRKGEMRLVSMGKTPQVESVSGVPKVAAAGQGGLLDVRVSPDFAEDGRIFFSYAKPMGKGQATTALGTARLSGKSLVDVSELFVATPAGDAKIHFGSRIEFGSDQTIFLTVGDRNERHLAQKLDNHLGKVLRLTRDGKPAPGNPFLGQKGALPEIWTFGHRNPQGLTVRPGTNELWESEFGPRGGDEINILQPGSNYGWPVVTFGREYWGPKIGEGTTKSGMKDPLIHWTPSISPSAIAFHAGAEFSKWNGQLFLANLSGEHLRRIEFKPTKSGGPLEVVKQDVMLDDLDLRFRSIRAVADGTIHLGTDQGTLLRIMR